MIARMSAYRPLERRARVLRRRAPLTMHRLDGLFRQPMRQASSQTAGGCWTPAAAMASALLKRLPENVGLTFSVEE